jgi:DNA-binding transcriptional LysR family regulator
LPNRREHHIAELGNGAGCQAVHPTTQFVTLTNAGEAFLTEAFKITSLSREAATKTRQIALGQSGSLKVGFVSRRSSVPCRVVQAFFTRITQT